MPNEKFLQEGPQTKFTDLVREHAERARKIYLNNREFQNVPEEHKSIYRTCRYITTLPKIQGYTENPLSDYDAERNERIRDVIFRSRDLDRVLREGIYPTCSDTGLLFRGLMAAQKIPVSHLETFHEDYLFGRSFHGHVFCRVYLDEGSVIVNPKPIPTITEKECEILPYVVVREGLDSWDIGIRTYDELHKLREAHLKELLDKYEVDMRKNFLRRITDLHNARNKEKYNILK